MKILVRVTNWIGDVVMNIPALERLRQAYPQAEITALGRPSVLEVLQFRKDLVDRTLPIQDKDLFRNPRQLRQTVAELRAERFELALIFTKHMKGALLAMLSGIPRRWGLKTWENRLFLNGGVDFKSLPKTARHQSRNYVDILEAELGASAAPPSLPRLHPDPELARQVRARLLPNAKSPLLLVQAGAAFGTAKRWLPERYAQTCSEFVRETGGSVALLGVPSEAELNQKIRETAGPGVIDLCGQTRLAESLALLSSCDLFVSGDSGLMHAAAAFTRPQAAIFGPTDWRTVAPSHPDARVFFHEVPCGPCFLRECKIGHHCMKGVQAEPVARALVELWRERAK